MSEEQKNEFIKNVLPGKILQELNRGKDEILEVELSTPEQLDGFMSIIHRLTIVTRDTTSSEKKTLNLMVKVMKGDDAFRESCMSKMQFTNEVYIYSEVLPCFKQLLLSNANNVRADDWCPKVFYSAAGKLPGYSNQYETILVMENISYDGFRAGPRNDLDEDHLMLMARRIAQFHACTYAMRIAKDEKLEKLLEGAIPLNFVDDDGKVFGSYATLFKLALDRIFEYIDRNPKELDSKKFKNDMNNLRTKHGSNPIILMQKFMKRDEYSVILHGDYNRNNVLFKYEDGKPVDLRMFDFQEHRYGTPMLDLTFFMCMSMPTGLRERLWNPLLKQYHESLMETVTDILKCETHDKRLEPYGYEKFMEHLNTFGLYGGMIAAHFLPWMLCPEEECSQLSFHFAKNVNSEEMKHWTRVAGGEDVDKRLVEILRHLSQLGCFDIVNWD